MKNKFKLLSALIMALLVTTSGPQPLMSITISANELPLSTTVMESIEAESPESIANSAIAQEMPILESTTTPTTVPTAEPTATLQPTPTPTSIPSTKATVTSEPTITPTAVPTAEPTTTPTPKTSVQATAEPTVTPTPTVSSVAGDTFTQDDWEYEVLSETEVSISKYNGENTTVDIPNEVLNDGQEYTVIKIGENAFSNCANITNVNFPESLVTIGENAFSNCVSLQSIDLPKNLKTLEHNAFYNCTKLGTVKINSDLENITGNSNWRSPFFRGDGYGSSAKMTVIFGNGVTRVAAYLFSGGSAKVTEVHFSDSITEIGASAFESCMELKSVDFPEHLEVIESRAFIECRLLESVNLPKSLKKLGSSVFGGNYTSLNYVQINSDLEDIHNLDAPPFVAYSSSTPGASMVITFGENVTRVPARLFYNENSSYSYVSKVNFSDNITEIGDYAFTNCVALTSIDLPKFLEKLGVQAFANCVSLTSINLPESLKDLGEQAFYNCTALSNVQINNNLSDIPTSVKIAPFSKKDSNNDNSNITVTFSENVTRIPARLFFSSTSYGVSGKSMVSEIHFSDSITEIGDSAFYKCEKLISVNLPRNLKK